MALVDDHMTVVGDAILHDAFAHETLDSCHVEASRQFLSAAANPTNFFRRYIEEL